MWPEVVEGSQKTTATMMATTATINIFTGDGARMTGRIVVLRVSPVAEYAATIPLAHMDDGYDDEYGRGGALVPIR